MYVAHVARESSGITPELYFPVKNPLASGKYGIKSNLLWFKKNVKNNDLNIILKFNNSLIGYTLLRKRTYFSKNKRKKFFYLDTIIISNKFKGKNFGKTLISFNNFITVVLLRDELSSFNSIINLFSLLIE